MTTSQTRPEGISRRTLTRGAAWAVPAIAAAQAAPAFAASRCGCFILSLPTEGPYTSTSQPRTSTVTGTSTMEGCPNESVSWTLRNQAGGNYLRTSSTGHGAVGTVGQDGDGTWKTIPHLPGGGAYVLNQRTGSRSSSNPTPGPAVTTITLTFPTQVTSLSFTMYDLSRVDTNYTDEVTFNRPVSVTGDNTNLNVGTASTIAVSANTKIYRTQARATSALTGSQRVVTTGAPFSSFSITYSNGVTGKSDTTNNQFMAFGSFEYCV